MSARASALAPAVDTSARVLVLGTLPGPMSLAREEYYGNPRNGFWRLVGGVIGMDLAALPYRERMDALRWAGIGLADVFASAVRPGGLDAAIREAETADLKRLLARLPDLRAVAFNGGLAARVGRREIGPAAGPDLLDLPSSSPAYAGMPFAEKAQRWAVLGRYPGGTLSSTRS